MSLRVALEPDRIALAPGESVTVRATVENAGDVVEHYSATVLGLPTGQMIETSPASCKLQPGESGSFTVRLGLSEDRPPTAARMVLGILVSSPYRAQVAFCAELPCEILAAPALTLGCEPATASGGRQVAYEARVANEGNTTLDLELSGSDAEGRARIEVEPARMRLGAGQVGYARVRVQARPPFTGQPATRRITLAARAGARSADTTVTMTQRPWIAGGVLRVVGAITGVTVMAGAILGAALLAGRALRPTTPPAAAAPAAGNGVGGNGVGGNGAGGTGATATPLTTGGATPSTAVSGTGGATGGTPATGTEGGGAVTSGVATSAGTADPAAPVVVDFGQQPFGLARTPQVIAATAYPHLALTAVPDTQRRECSAVGSSVMWGMVSTPAVGGFVTSGAVQQGQTGPVGVCMDLGVQIQFDVTVHEVSVDLVGLRSPSSGTATAPLTYSMSVPQGGGSAVTVSQVVVAGQRATLRFSDSSGAGIRQVMVSGVPPRADVVVALTRLTYR